MYKVAFASGKGGAGKTSIAAAIYKSIAGESIMIDCDVDASNCFIILENTMITSKPFVSGRSYTILPELCTLCGRCAEVCRFDAVVPVNGKYAINQYSCEGCGACSDVCEPAAVVSIENHCGDLYESTTIYGTPLHYAKLKPGEDNSGKLINELKKDAYKNNQYKYAVIDAPPGTGCPVISALSGIDLLVVVIEATESGFADAVKLMELVKDKKFGKVAVINKAGENYALEERILGELERRSLNVAGRISFNKEFYRLLGERKMITETEDPILRKEIEELTKNIKELLI